MGRKDKKSPIKNDEGTTQPGSSSQQEPGATRTSPRSPRRKNAPSPEAKATSAGASASFGVPGTLVGPPILGRDPSSVSGQKGRKITSKYL